MAAMNSPQQRGSAGKVILEALVCIIHPLAVALAWINLILRTDMDIVKKVLWGIVCIVPVGPLLYILLGDGRLW